MARLDELWRTAGGPGLPPSLDSRRVKARVNAALDARPTERKIYMKQKWRAALAAAAAVAAITGTAFAATVNWNVLTPWFQGDPTPVQEYVDSQVRSVSDGNYTLTVEGCVADEHSAYLTVTITALSDEAKEFLWDDRFISIDTFDVFPVLSSGETPSSWGNGSRDLDGSTETTRRFAMSVDDISDSVAALRLRCGYMEEGKWVEVPITPAPSVTVKIGASGSGALSFTPQDDDTVTISEIILTPLTCHFYGRAPANVMPNIRLRMADGSILTQSQVMKHTGSSLNEAVHQYEDHYRFKEIQDLDNIVSIIVFDTEYPLDGSAPTPVEHDPALDPFTVETMEPLAEDTGYTIPVQELTEKLGGTYSWDADRQSATCVYRGVTVVLSAGNAVALVDGREVEMHVAPAEQDGIFTADFQVFLDAWGIDMYVQREIIEQDSDREIIWHDWYIIP